MHRHDSTMKTSRKRSRIPWIVVVAAAVTVPNGGVQAWSALRTFARTTTTTLSATTRSTTTTEALLETTTHNPVAQSYYDYDKDYNEQDNDDDQVMASVPDVLQWQDSVESDILPSHEQELIDAGPTAFLERHSENASDMEKVAMRSITQQLPSAAVQALEKTNKSSRKTNKSSRKTKSKTKSRLDNAFDQRVSPARELQLARIIQQGAALHKLRTGSMTTQQWAGKAGLSPKELRRQVVSYRKAKHDLVTANMGLVHAVVQQMWRPGTTGITKEEMVQEGSLGLLRAAELFDPDKGLRFSTYAVVWIKGVLSNTHLPELVKLPLREKTKWNKICQAQRDILGSHGLDHDGNDDNVFQSLRVPMEQLSAVTGLSPSEILWTQRRMSQAQRVLSLDFEYNTQSRSGVDDGTSNTVANRIVEQEDADMQERTQLQADILAALAKNLDPREARLMRLRYGLSSDSRPRTLNECAEAMGLSYTRVHQLSQQCLKKLRQAAEAESLEEYLFTIA